jgi:inosine-uridine nucleoside N-ribohydrolase
MDPGIDDALALYAALARLDVRGLATVAGNVDLDRTFENGRQLLQLAGRSDVPVWPGSRAPIFMSLHTAPEIHGPHGMGAREFSEPTAAPALSETPWQAWPALWSREPEPVHLIATGPMTNVAKLLWCLPEGEKHLTGITVMGGAVEGGNVTPTAEFNFYVDPEAADAVLAAPVPVSMVGLDVTWKARMPWSDVERMAHWGAVGQLLADALGWYGRHGEAVCEGLAVHDAVAVTAYAHPEWFTWEPMKLSVRADGRWRGTVVRVPGTASDRRPVRVAVDVETGPVMDWIMESVAHLADAAPK